MQKLPYKRVLLKLSGEILSGNKPFGIDSDKCLQIASCLSKIHESGVQLSVVIGGGNIFRGSDLIAGHLPRTMADQMGMLSTLFNGVALEQALLSLGVPAVAMSAIECPSVVQSYNWTRAMQLMDKGTVLIFVGGTGNPYFSTDSAAALRASEMGAQVVMKATKVDGVFDKDPMKHKDAHQYSNLSFAQVLAEKLQVMDATAFALCRSNQIPIYVFNMKRLLEEPFDQLLSSGGTWVRE